MNILKIVRPLLLYRQTRLYTLYFNKNSISKVFFSQNKKKPQKQTKIQQPKKQQSKKQQPKAQYPNKQYPNKQQPKKQQPKKQQPKKQQHKEQQQKKQSQHNSPNQDPTNNNYHKAKSKIKNLLNNITIQMNRLYYHRFSISQIIIISFLFGLAFYGYTNEVELTPTQFMNLINTQAFKEIQFVQEDFLITQKTRIRKVYGKINNQNFFTYVLNFDTIMEKVMKNPQIKCKNTFRKGLDAYLHFVYKFIDVISLIVILKILSASLKRQDAEISKKFGGSINKSKRFQLTKNINIKFKDVAGMQECKRQVQEIVDFLVNPTKYHLLGATIPKGVLLTGPPGTGKTLLAKACAGQANVPFYSVSGSDFVEMFVGVGASRVRELFQEAKQNSPSIIFIDELDAIGKKRLNKLGSSDERQGTLNQLLVEMDGFGTNNSVIVMGATNRKQILDNALVRAGRFDREVEVGLPDVKGRYQIFLVHLIPLVLSKKFTIQEYAKRLASLTPGFSGAEIANLCNEAAILAARYNKGIVEMIDFELSSQRVIGGVERKGFVSLKEKKTVAYHECGHAVVSWFLQGADPLLKVTIIPRSKGALGFAQYFVNENQLQTKQELVDRICFILGGRCAQKYFFNQITTGAYDDLSKAYDICYQIVAKFGMNKQIGYVAFPDTQYVKSFSEKVQSTIDEQIHKIIKQCTEKTEKMVQLYSDKIKMLAEELLIKETLDVRMIQKILGKRPFAPNKTFESYLQVSAE